MNTDLFLQQFGHLAQGEGGVQKLRDLILQLAVRGKLVPQDPNDEPASELLRQVGGKQLPQDNYDFSIPDSWVWTQLNQVASYIQRGKGPKYSDIKQVPVVSQKCVQWSGFESAPMRFIEPESLEKYKEERFLQKEDLLWNSTGTGTIGRVCIFPGSQEYEIVVADSHVTIVRLFSELSSRFAWCWLASPDVQRSIVASGSTNQIELGTL